eukprot:TRINITY_DN1525_c0_g1_i1.p2 TRINITY_DN1525_c0_g1~~TRINITY_DN1525_c0_g1_i1.p2  ORF type:complete len:362 (+),score=81.19 TRINITY_DN1525_c0_g1_i1:865-1950(+)
MSDELIFLGTYSVGNVYHKGAGVGVHVISLSPDGALHEVSSIASANPTFLALHPNRKVLYAVNEIEEFRGARGGSVSAYSIAADGRLALLGEQPTIGTGPCHVSLDASGRTAFVANYGGGSVASYPVGPDGALGAPAGFSQHPGSAPHAHSVVMDPANRFAYACDLGDESIWIYKPDLDRGSIFPMDADLAKASSDDARSVSVQAGSGPRHAAFSSDGRWLYVINEHGNTLMQFAVDPTDGGLSLVDTVSTLPEGYAETSYASDVKLSADGRFLYGANRGHNSIVIFSVDQSSGRLTLVGHEPCGGSWPRHFSFSRSGAFLLIANQKENLVKTFRVNRDTGLLTPTGHAISLGSPTVVLPY